MSEREDVTMRRENLSPVKQALLEQRLSGLSSRSEVKTGVSPKPAQVPARLSFAQERMYFAAQLNPESTAYNMHAAYRLRGHLDVSKLERSLNFIFERHDVLRTRFLSTKGNIEPVVVDFLEATIPITDLSGMTEAEQSRRLKIIGKQEAQQLFNLAEVPLLKLSLARLKPDEHVIFLTLHHIISDEWSIMLFWRELQVGYAALTNNQPVEMQSQNLQYVDFAFWQREQFESGALDDQMETWLERLAPPQTRLQFPFDQPRPHVQRHKGAIAALRLPAQIQKELTHLNQDTGTTPFMVLLALYAALLYRYTGQEDILIGIPITNRNLPDFENLFGVCLNTLVLRVDLKDSPTFSDLLERVRSASLEAFANSETPFEKLVEALKPARDLSYHPLFQVMFVYQSQPSQLELPGLQVEPFLIDGGVSKFDLTLFASESGEGFEIFLEYDTDLIEGQTANRFLSNLKVMAESALRNPETAVSRLPIHTKEERQLLLKMGEPVQSMTQAETSIQALVEFWAEQKPSTPALLFENQSMSYQTFNERANLLANNLRSKGVGRNVVVALCAERSFELFIGMLGILKAGGAYLPLDPKYPLERRDFMLKDAGVQHVVTQSQFAGSFQRDTQHLFLLQPGAERAADQADPLQNITQPSDLAYVIYTSGSTGKPKGVPVTHANLLDSTAARIRYYPEKTERFLLLSSYSFDSSVAGIFGTLCAGGTLCLPAQGQEMDVNVLAELIYWYKVTHMLCLPSLYSLLLEYTDHRQLNSLAAVIVAGEACPVKLVRQHYSALPKTALYNEYGPTEGTVWCSVYRVPPDLTAHSVPIGKPIEISQLFILDRHLEPVPVGVHGELYLAGTGVVSGYLNRPDLTQEHFTEHAWDNGRSVRLYRTGDLARWLPDGNIEYLGRIDQQVKISGYRIELEEIETALLALPGIAQAVVLAREEPSLLEPEDIEGLSAAIEAAGEPGLALLAAIERSLQSMYERKGS
jgi:myxalamid-type nonribosomal peptide synthetase MxaA